MEKEYPTEEELEKIKNWKYEDDYEKLAEFICAIWHFEDWAELRGWAVDDLGTKYRELRLATAGWSGNESIIGALEKNTMFMMICWVSSHRGGLHIFHIIKIGG